MDGIARSGEELSDYCPACGGEIALGALNGDGSSCPHCGRPLWFVERKVDGAAVITFVSSLVSGHDTPKQVETLLSAIGNASQAVFDLERLHFVPPSFLKLLVLLHHRLGLLHKAMKICGLHAHNSAALRRTRLATLFEICPDPQSALSQRPSA